MKLKKKRFIVLPILIVLIAVCAAVYLGYGSTMINPDNENSIINYLSIDKDNPITILAQEKYKNYIGILYTDPSDENNNTVHFDYFEKHNLYKNRYQHKGESSGNNGPDNIKLDMGEKNECYFFIYDQKSDYNKCSVFETENGIPIKKLEELDIKNTAYLITRNYNLENKDNEILLFNGSYSLKQILKYFQE